VTQPDDALPAVRRMLEPRSIAVVGASVKSGSLGESMMAELRRGGFEGAIYPVNPGYEDVLPNHPTLGDVDSPEALEAYQAAKRAHKAAMRAAKT